MNKVSLISYGKKTDLAMKTWMQVIKTHDRFSKKELEYFKEHKLTISQFKVLEVLYHRGNLNISAITKLTLSTPGNITVVIKNLKRDNLIISLCNQDDKRANILSLSAKGEKIIKKIFPQHAKNINEYMDVLDEKELETLYSLLKKVYKK